MRYVDVKQPSAVDVNPTVTDCEYTQTAYSYNDKRLPRHLVAEQVPRRMYASCGRHHAVGAAYALRRRPQVG